MKKKTAQVYKNPDKKSRSAVLIYGDEVMAQEQSTSGMTRIKCRGEDGYISAGALGDRPALEMYFIDVGTGDSTYIVTPRRKKILIDGGLNKRALGFLVWKYRLDKPNTSVDIDLLVLTHADDDHIKGLIPVIQHPKINVKKIIHSGIATYAQGAFKTGLGDRTPDKKYLTTRHSQLSELDGAKLNSRFKAWLKAIEDEGSSIKYDAVSLDTGQIDLGDKSVDLDILGPRLQKVAGKPAYQWFKDEAHTINGHSVVLRLTHKNVRVLLAGDLNTLAEESLLKIPGRASFSAHVFKAPHHGSNDFAPAFLKAVRPQVSVISSGDDRDFGHPSAIFVGSVGQASRSDKPLVFSTEIAANFVKLAKEEEPPAPASANPDAKRRQLFKRRLHGMINVRSDGDNLYAARRVATYFWWEAYDPAPAAP